ncbi:cupin domain-containing protein [Chloroflexota bacterium]
MERKEPYATPEEFNRCITRYRDIPIIEMAPGVKAHILSSERMTVIYVTLAPNSFIPLHHHEQEQIMTVVEGECDEIIDGKLYHLKEGDVVRLASNQEHGTYVSEKGCLTIEVFSPVREDYVAKMAAVKKSLRK